GTGRELSSAILRGALTKQELVDAAVLEATIANLVRRDNTRPGTSDPPPQASVEGKGTESRTQAAVPIALSSLEGVPASYRQPSIALEPEAEQKEAQPSIGPREVRHVALVTLRLHGIKEAEAQDDPIIHKAVQNLRVMLGEMAYKRGMRWIWDSDG